MTNPSAKLREARYFLTLLGRIERTGLPLVGSVHDIRDEYTFMLGAFLGACYAATEHLEPVAGAAAVKQFKKAHPRIHGPGLRNATVHERHISPSLSPYLSFDGEGRPAAPPTLVAEYWFDPGQAPARVTELCAAHLDALLKFAERFGVAPDM